MVAALGQNGAFWVATPSLNGSQMALLMLVGREEFLKRVPWGALSHMEENAEFMSRHTERLRVCAKALQKSYLQEWEAVATLKAASNETAGFPTSPKIKQDSIERHERKATHLCLLLDYLKAIIGARENSQNELSRRDE
jgi:hypothetical protein